MATEELIRVRRALPSPLRHRLTHLGAQETKIGVAVNKLRQNPSKEVADLAKEIVRKWKADVGPAASRPSKSDTSSESPSLPRLHAIADSHSPIASNVASPSPAPGSPPATKASKPKPSISSVASSSAPSTSASKPSPAPAPSTSSAPPAPKRRESLNGAPRTHKSDGLEFGKGEGSTGDKTRDKCAEMIYDALASDSDARESVLRSSTMRELTCVLPQPPTSS